MDNEDDYLDRDGPALKLHSFWYLLLNLWVRSRRGPDKVIGPADDPYMLRWYVIPRNKWFNIYLHIIVRSDKAYALHDHPWWNLSYLLKGMYVEHTIDAGGINQRVIRSAGDLKLRSAKYAHRIEVDKPVCSLFLTGPNIREWGFHCPKMGWRHWKVVTGDGSDDNYAEKNGTCE